VLETKVFRPLSIALASSLVVLAMSGCASATPDKVVDPSTSTAGSLVIDGEEIADAELWKAAQSEGEFTYYTAQPESTAQPIIDAFTKETGIKVNMVRLSGGPLAERVLSEVAGNQLAADVIQASDLEFAQQLKGVKALEKYTVPSAPDLEKSLVDPDQLFTPWSTAAMALAYNSALVKPADVPKSWADLLNSKWAGKIGIFDIGTGGSAWAVALFQRQVVSPDYWTKLAKQKPAVFSGNAPLAESLTRGEIEVGYASPGLIVRAKKGGAPVDVIFPKEGFPAFVSFLALTKTAKNVNAGKVYMNWATSVHGETLITAISGDYMSNTKVPTPGVDGTKFPAEGPWVAKTSDWLDLRADWSKEYRAVFGESAKK
jgi:iron(III) transport system substrate-binding protein